MLCLSDLRGFLLCILDHSQVNSTYVVLFSDDLHIGFVIERVLQALAQTFCELDVFLLLLSGQVSFLDVASHFLLEFRCNVEVVHRRVGAIDSALEGVLLLLEHSELPAEFAVEVSDEEGA